MIYRQLLSVSANNSWLCNLETISEISVNSFPYKVGICFQLSTRKQQLPECHKRIYECQ